MDSELRPQKHISLEHLAESMANLPFPVQVLNDTGNPVFSNKAFQDLLGALSGDEVPPFTQPLEEFEGTGLPRQEVWDSVQNQGKWSGDVVLPGNDSRARIFEVRILAWQSLADSMRFYSVLLDDKTEERTRQSDAEKKREHESIVLRQRQLSEVLSLLAHQWRQPLTLAMSLLGNVQLKARRGPLDQEYLENKLERMATTLQNLSDTIDTVRQTYSPSQARVQDDLFQLLRRALISLEPRLERDKIAVRFENPSTKVLASVYSGEIFQLCQQLINLAREALVLGSESEPILTVGCRTVNSGTELWFEDNRSPLPLESPEYVLALSRFFVEQHHNGTLSAGPREGLWLVTCWIPGEHL